MGEPVVGAHLTLVAARKLTSEVHRLRKLGRDPVAERRPPRLKHKHQIIDSGEATFPNAVKFYIENGRRKRVRKGVLKDRAGATQPRCWACVISQMVASQS